MAHDLAEVSSDFAHELFGPQLVEVDAPMATASLADLARTKWGVGVWELEDVWSARSDSSFKARLLKAIISGPLDCDKIDYVRRDSTHLGVTFGLALDHERLLRNVTTAYAPRTEPGQVVPEKMDFVGLAVTEKALVVAESLLRIRKDLFTQVYWHHTVRSLKAMLAFAVRNTLLALDEPQQQDAKEQFWVLFHRDVLWLSRLDNEQWRTVGSPTVPAGHVVAEDDWLGPDYMREGIGTSGLSRSDDDLLLFFRKLARGREQRMIDAIRARRLFKRVYVLTYQREKTEYDRIYDRFHTYRLEGNLREIERLREACEHLVREQVLENADKKLIHLPNAVVAEFKDQVASADPLILLDVPVKAVSRTIERESIYFMPEDIADLQDHRAGMRRIFATTPIPLQEPPFDKAVGKIRLFAPPALKDGLLRCIPDHHEKFTEILIA